MYIFSVLSLTWLPSFAGLCLEKDSKECLSTGDRHSYFLLCVRVYVRPLLTLDLCQIAHMHSVRLLGGEQGGMRDMKSSEECRQENQMKSIDSCEANAAEKGLSFRSTNE